MIRSLQSPRLPSALAGLVPLLVYLLTASGHGFWLDSAEFTAAALELDIAHPPGHPLFCLWSLPFTWLPVGPLPFRVALAGAVAAALALACTHVAIARSLQKLGLTNVHAQGLLALAACWTLAGAYGFWFQAVRAEVYALEAMLVCCALERISAIEYDAAMPDPRPFYGACLALGFGLANHHLIAVLALPPLGYALLRLLRAHGARVLLGSLVAGALGLVCYLYLPLRAATLPPMDLGHPVRWADFAWVVRAQVYARHIGTGALQPLDERFADLVILLIENFTPFVLPLALLGAYALLRTRATWPLSYLWLSTALISLCGRAFLNPVRDNPDVLGYMMPGFAALLALAAVGVAAPFTAAREGASRAVLLSACGLLALLGLGQFVREADRASLRSFHASDDFDDLRRRALPTRALVVWTTPDAAFRHWEGEAVEQLRADVTMLPLPFLGYGSTEQVILARAPTLAPLLESYARDGRLSVARLQELARERPVYVELDTAAALPLLPFVVPDGLLYRVLPQKPSARDLQDASVARRRTDLQLHTRVDRDAREPETRRQLLWTHYIEALYFAWHGALPQAREATSAGLALAPQTRELLLLDEALRSATGALELTPYLVGRAH